MKTTSPVLVALLSAACSTAWLTPASAGDVPPLKDILRDGLYQEEVNRDQEAAAKAYEQLLARNDEGRTFAATALFRLAEVHRKQGRREDAITDIHYRGDRPALPDPVTSRLASPMRGVQQVTSRACATPPVPVQPIPEQPHRLSL